MKALSPLAILLSALLLQGCVAAAVVGTAAVGTKAATDPRTVGTQVDDSTLELRVNSALSKDEQIKKQARINVTAYQGKVLLTGQSPTPDLSARAKQIAMGVEGTTEVFNEVRQGQPIGLGTASSDTWITTKVRSQLLSTDQVKSSNVKSSRTVYLISHVHQRLKSYGFIIMNNLKSWLHLFVPLNYYNVVMPKPLRLRHDFITSTTVVAYRLHFLMSIPSKL